MTPEQEAFFEYGKAREALRIFKTYFAYREETLREFYEIFIRDAWQKRAVCRAWNPPEGRTCENCLHKGKSIGDHPCFSCTPPNGSINNWEPRKEGGQ